MSSAAAREKDYGGTAGAAKAAGYALLRGATVGLSDPALTAVGADPQDLRALEEEHPGISGAGEFVGALAPSLVAPESLLGRAPAGQVAKIGHAIAANVEGSGAGVLGRAAGAAIGAGLEGSIYGGGQYLSQVAIEDKPLAAEGLFGAMGKGALWGLPIGGALSLGGEALVRAKSLFPSAQVTKEAAKAADLEAASTFSAAVRDGDEMAARARQRIQIAEAQAGSAQAGESAARAIFGDAGHQAVADQVGANVERQHIAQALDDYTRSQQALTDWVRAEADPDLEAALVGIRSPDVQVGAPTLRRPGYGESPPPARLRDLGEFGLDAEQPAHGASGGSQIDKTNPGRRVLADGTPAPGGQQNADLEAMLSGRIQQPEIQPGVSSGPYERPHWPPELPDEPGINYAEAGRMLSGGEPAPQTRVLGNRSVPTRLPDATPPDPVDLSLFHSESRPPAEVAQEITRAGRRPAALDTTTPHAAVEPTNVGRRPAALADARPLSPAEFAEIGKVHGGAWGDKTTVGLHGYSSSDLFQGLNKQLRAGSGAPGKYLDEIKALDRALERTTLPRDTQLYRGVSGAAFNDQLAKLRPGDTFIEHGYMSTSADPAGAKLFSGRSASDPGAHITVDVPAGTHAGAIPSKLRGTERELLLPRGSRFRVVSTGTGADGKPAIHLRLESEGVRRPPAVRSTPAREPGGILDVPTSSRRAPKEVAADITRAGRRPALPKAAAEPATAPVGRIEVKRLGPSRDRKLEVTAADGSKSTISSDDVYDWIDKTLPAGFRSGGSFSPHLPFSIERELPASQAAIRENAIYIARPNQLADHGIYGNEIHPEHATSMAAARRDPSVRLDPIQVDVTPDGKWYIEDGNHRLQEAAKTNAEVAIEFRPRTPGRGWEPQSNAREISDRLRGAAEGGHASTAAGEAAPEAAPAVNLPDGFDLHKVVDGQRVFNDDPTLHTGVPEFKDLSRATFRDNAYIVRPSELADLNVLGIRTGDDLLTDSRTQSISDALSSNKKIAPVEIDVSDDGHYFVADGNHRVIAAALDGDRPIVARFRPTEDDGIARMDALHSDIRRALEGEPAATVAPEPLRGAHMGDDYDPFDVLPPPRKAKAVVVPEGPPTGLTRTNRSAGGSQGGAWYRDANGQQWFGKTYGGSADRVEGENIANRIYRMFGVDAPETHVVEHDGQKMLVSREVPGEMVDPKQLANTNAKDGFVIDAWLGNLDVVGMGGDNMLVSNGRVHRVDNGGSTIWRAQGAPKEFGHKVGELESMRHNNGSSGEVFGSLTDAEVNSQIALFADRYKANKDKIWEILNRSGLSNSARDKIRYGLEQRANWLVKRPYIHSSGDLPEIDFDDYQSMRRDYSKRLSAAEERSCREYSGNAAYDLNAALRSGKLGNYRSLIINDLDKAINKAKLANPIIVWRGLEGDEVEKLFSSLKVGDAFMDPAYSSSSISHDMAHRGSVTLKIEVPAGYPAAPIPSNTNGEAEFLLRRGTKFEITGRQEGPPVDDDSFVERDVIYSVRVVPEKAPKLVDKTRVDKVDVLRKSDVPEIPPGTRDNTGVHRAAALRNAEARARPLATEQPDGETELERLLRGTKGQLDSGKSIGEVGASSPARAKYVEDKAALRAQQADEFRGRANAANYAASAMGDAERAAQPAAIAETHDLAAPPSARYREMLDRLKGRTTRVPAAPGAAAETGETELERLLRGTKQGLDDGASMRGMAEASGAGPLSDRVAARPAVRDDLPASEPPARKVPAPPEIAKTIVDKSIRPAMDSVHDEEMLQRALRKHAGKNVNIGDDLARAARVIGDFESASANLADVLGADAPPTAVQRAQAYRAAVGAQADASGTSAARAAADITNKLGPGAQDATKVDDDVMRALRRHESKQARSTPAAKATPVPGGASGSPAPVAGGSAASSGAGKALKIAADVGTALEVLHALGVHTPDIEAIPVIGPVLSLYLKARAMLGIIGRKGGSIAKTTESVIAARAAQVRNRIGSAVAATLDVGAKAARAAAPVAGPAAALGYRLFPGKGEVKSKDPRELYKARLDELARAQAPGAIEQAIADRIRTSDPNLQDAIVAQAQRATAFLASKAPKPSLMGSLAPSDGTWHASRAQIDQFSRYVAAVHDPAGVLEDLSNGHISLEGAEVIRAVYPSLLREAQLRLLEHASKMTTALPYKRRVSISIMYGLPLDGTMTASHLRYLASSGGGGQGGAGGAPAAAPPPATGPAITAPFQIGQQTMTSLERRAGG